MDDFLIKAHFPSLDCKYPGEQRIVVSVFAHQCSPHPMQCQTHSRNLIRFEWEVKKERREEGKEKSGNEGRNEGRKRKERKTDCET